MTTAAAPLHFSQSVWVRQVLPSVAVFIVFGLALYALYHLFSTINVGTVVAQVKALPLRTVLLSLITTAASYIALIGYDWSALRFIGKSVPPAVLAAGSFAAYAIGNTVGLSALSGGAVRYRFYSAVGLDASDVALVSAFCAISFGVGVVAIGCAALVYDPIAVSSIFSSSGAIIRYGSLAIVAAIAMAIGWASILKKDSQLGRTRFTFPDWRVLIVQIAFSLADICFAAATLYLLLPADANISFLAFLVVFSAAAVAAVISHVPGGVGVFEGVVAAGLANTASLDAIAASLIAYRVIYYLIPFFAGILTLSAHELFDRRISVGASTLSRHLRPVLDFGKAIAPVALSGMIFLSGVLLLLAGLTPISAETTDILEPLVPLAPLEVSTIATGAFGMFLIILSASIRRRAKAAFWITLALLLGGAASILVQRLDVDRAIMMLGSAGVLYIYRREFNRASRLTSRILSLDWVLLVGAVILASAFVLLISYRDAAYTHGAWWQFAIDAHMPRALRASAAAAIVVVGCLAVFALRPPRNPPEPLANFKQLEAVVAGQDDPDANFVFTGDKSALASDEGDAFIMYAVHGRSWVALGDPVGARSQFEGIVQDFVQAAGRHNCRAAFYQVSDRILPLYIDNGFVLNKLGEEGVVRLESFSLEGASRKGLRGSRNRALRDGLTFRIAYPSHDAAFMEELRSISDEWLSARSTGEKSFSLGRFDPAYLSRFPIAMVEQDGLPVAFANIMTTDTKAGATIDLMRHRDSAPHGAMEFLFIELLLRLRGEGYQWFSVGLAPLSGLERSARKHLWERLGAALYRHGGRFYNFVGLRQFKEKFDPEWHPRYLATTGGLDPLLVLADVNALVSGGIKGALTK